MIEFVSYRIRENLKAYLPENLEKMRNFWREYDMDELGREIRCEDPRNDSGGSSYYIGRPNGVPQYPAIIIIENNTTYPESNKKIDSVSFKDAVHTFEIRMYVRLHTEKRENVTRSLMRLSTSVVNTLGFHTKLTDVNTKKDGICVQMAMGDVVYKPSMEVKNGFLQGSAFILMCRVLNSLRNRIYYPI